jgi:GxxExxY protein
VTSVAKTTTNDPLTEKVIACAYKVYNTLGFGFLEKVYENSMAIGMRKAGVHFKQQYPISVYYDEENVGDYEADLFVDDRIVVELKSVRKLVEKHEVQLVHYLKATKQPIGLLINFGPDGVEVKRKYRDGIRQDQHDLT